jgi:phage baseplate assembly protein gpV
MSLERFADEMREIFKRLDDADRRIASMFLTGQVSKVEGDKAEVTFSEKDEGTGKPFKSPMLRLSNQTGHDGQGVREFKPVTVGETVGVISPSGELGPNSRIIPWGPTDENPAPASKPEDGYVLKSGNASITLKDGKATVAIGDGTKLELTSAGAKVKHKNQHVVLNDQGITTSTSPEPGPDPLPETPTS